MATQNITEVRTVVYEISRTSHQYPITPLGVAQPTTTYYRMRGIDQTCPAIQQPAYVYWIVEDEPDLTAAQLDPAELPCGSDPLTDVIDIHIAESWTVVG